MSYITFISKLLILRNMFEEGLPLLLHIAEITKINNSVKIQTNIFAAVFGFSQQTASRKLMELEKKGLIARKVFIDGIELKLTDKGKKIINKHYFLLKSLYDVKENKNIVNVLRGIVKTGLGEGKFYMQIKQYIEPIKNQFGFTPYPGTLNLSVDSICRKEFLSEKKMFSVNGFSTPRRAYGGMLCCAVKIKRQSKIVAGVLIIPERTNHSEEFIELIAPVYLRDALSVKDNDVVEIV
jgi:riboflavin kinase